MNISFQADKKTTSDAALRTYVESGNIDPLTDIRSSALQQYLKTKLPTRKSEHWKYNDMSFLSQSDFCLNPSRQSAIDSRHEDLLKDTVRIKLVDGHLSKIENTESNITVTTFCNADPQQLEIIRDNSASTKQNKNLLVNLNMALSSDGILIEITASAEPNKPIYIIHETLQNDAAKIVSNQIIVHCKENSQVRIVEQLRTSGNSLSHHKPDLSLQQTAIHLSKKARCQHYRLNMESQESRQVSRSVVRLMKGSSYKGFYFSEGSQLNKTDIDILHQGQRSESELIGIYLPSDNRCIDYHTNIEHQVANCTSREIFRGIIADAAKATFSGKIHIFKDAQKTDAQLNNKNLLLTNKAEINTKPELEIYADDVICAHGATVAKINEQAIYYLQTRGIKSEDAKRMLSQGFIKELVDKIKDATIKQVLSILILKALSKEL